MKIKLLLALLLFCTEAYSQTSWTNVGNGLQQRVVAGKTEYRFTKTTPYAPFGITDTLSLYQKKSDVVPVPDATASIKGILKLNNDLGGTADAPTVKALTSSANRTTWDGSFTGATPNTMIGVIDDAMVRLTPGAVKNYIGAGLSSGIATLDASGKVPLTQINDALLGAVNYRGSYDAALNSPALPSAAAANKGYYWIVSTAGTQQGLTLNIGDWVISNGISYSKVDNNNSVVSVNGKAGAVTLNATDVGALSDFSVDPRYGITAVVNNHLTIPTLIIGVDTASIQTKQNSNTLAQLQARFSGKANIIGGNSFSGPQSSNGNFTVFGTTAQAYSMVVQSTTTSAYTKMAPEGFSLHNNGGLYTRFIPDATNTISADVRVRNLAGTMALTSDFNGENLQAITNRGSTTTSGAKFGGSLVVGSSTASSLGIMQAHLTNNINLVVAGGADPSAIAISGLNDAGGTNIPIEFRGSKYNFALGNVGIDIPSPATKLAVGGSVSILDATPYYAAKPSSWSDNFYMQAGINTTGTAAGDYVGFQNPSGKGYFFSQAGNRLLTVENGKITVGSSGGATGSPTAIVMDNTYANSAAGSISYEKLKIYLYRQGTDAYGFGLDGNAQLSYYAGTISTEAAHAFYTGGVLRTSINAAGVNSNAFNVTSKRSSKENIRDYTVSALGVVNSVKIKSFNYKSDPDKNFKVGFIADDTDALLATKEHDKMDVGSSIGILLKAVQELSVEVEALKAQLKTQTAN
jgi:hypothetical protein